MGNFDVQKVLPNACYVNPEEKEPNGTVTTQPEAQEPVVKKAEEDPNKGLKVQSNPADEDPVEAYTRKSQEFVKQSEQTLRNLGIKPKSLEYSGTIEDFKPSNTEEDYKYRYRQMRYNGQTDMTDEEIDKQAKLQMQNKGRKEKFEHTHTFLDKAEYKQAEAEKDAYYKQLRNSGVSRKEAKAQATEKFGENKYLSNGGWFGIGKSSARKYIERNQDLFYENGNFSEEKFDDYELLQAQRGQKEGDETSYRYSLRKRREATEYSRTEGRKTTVHQQGKLAEAAGLSTEKNNTLLYSAVGTAATFGAGAILQEVTGISGAIGKFNACGQLCKGVTFPLGLPVYIKDKGEEIEHIKAIKPQIPQAQPQPVPQPEPVTEPQQPEPVQVVEEPCYEDAYCDSVDTIKRGENWSKRILAGNGVTINGIKLGYNSKESRALLKAYIHAEKLEYGVTDMTENRYVPAYSINEDGKKVANHFRYYTNFDDLLSNAELVAKYPELELLRGAIIIPDCNSVTKAGKITPDKNYRNVGKPKDTQIPCP